jgi:NAD(P)-dependent dehydrogenase (short-subunit alcohol dehydrogenase family)
LWSKTLSAHVKGVFIYSQAAAQKMVQMGRGGRIINIASMDAMRPSPHPVLGESGGNSVAQITKALALEFGPFKITANALAPGIAQTPSFEVQAVGFKSANRMQDFISSQLPDPPRDRMGGAEEIATTVLFLVSEAAASITGNLVVVE